MREIILSVRIQLYSFLFLKSLILASSVAFIGLCFSQTNWFFIVLFLLTFVLAGHFLGLFLNNKNKAIRLIHENLKESEYSLDLLEKENPNIAEQLQLERLSKQIVGFKLPKATLKSMIPYFFIPLFPLMLWNLNFSKKDNFSKRSEVESVEKNGIEVSFISSEISVNPPIYTKQNSFKSTNLNVSAPEGSFLTWKVRFSNEKVLKVVLSNQQGKELAFIKNKNNFEYSDKLIGSGLYSIRAYLKDSVIYQSDFYHLESILDKAPKIEPKTKELYTLHYLNDSKILNISAEISDDYMVQEVFLVATLARGSGENVKFREMNFPVSKANFKSSLLTKSIDLKAMNFTPGDELYYYWAARDNKVPQSNFTKSDTYFLVYKDTSDIGDGDLATMAVNILPEYFRSQRQIIIDTEKLIAKRNKLKSKDFGANSNEIGFEQKALRIRYGQYLGEEYESSIGGGHNHSDEENLLDGFMHKHDSEEEGHHDHGHEGHNHAESTSKEENLDPLAALLADYVHSHDDAETNTFYEQSTRSLLKTALENMWQSELHLRLFEPEKALPYQKKALEFLKEAQHKARTFMAKSSYDPPPIKVAESRFKGELKKFNAKYFSKNKLTKSQIRDLASEVLGYLELNEKYNSVQKMNIILLSNQLNQTAVESGLKNWNVLTLLRKMLNDKTLNKEERGNLKKGLFELTGVQTHAEVGNKGNNKDLIKAFWNNL